MEVKPKELTCDWYCPCDGEKLTAIVKINDDMFTQCDDCKCIWRVNRATFINITEPTYREKYKSELKLVKSLIGKRHENKTD